MGRWAKFFQLLLGEDVDSDKMDFRVTMLSCLRGRHVDDLAGAAFDHHKAVLAQSGTLHRIGSGSASIGAVEGVLMLSKDDCQLDLHLCGMPQTGFALEKTIEGK